MGAKHSSSPALALAVSTAEDQATALPTERFHRYSLNLPRLVVGRRQCQSSQRKLKGKRNVSATFNINEYEIPYDSQESYPHSCISSLSSTQNVFSSASSISNGSPAVVASAATADDSNRGCSFVGGEFNRENLLLNINTATEEGLMTLPGVTRQTARNVVSYRKLIGGFKNIQDIALVSGVGASLYVRFKSEITCLPSDPQEQCSRRCCCLTSSVVSGRKSKSSTLSKHSSASSSGIDIATINEDDDNDCNKIVHQRTHQHHNNNNNNTNNNNTNNNTTTNNNNNNNNNNTNNNNSNKASTAYENDVIVNNDTNIGSATMRYG